jgi:short subunit dehydrogenase-like uncharacterized protein
MQVAVYGATGHTGRLVLSELDSRRARCVIGGRDRSRLDELAHRHECVAKARPASLDDPRGLRGFLDGCDVAINCAGQVAGDRLIDAAIDSRVGYVDAVGDQPFIRKVFERYADDARRAEIPVVPALGFDYAIGDWIARLAAAGCEPLRELVIAYALSGSGVSRDALSAGAEGFGGGEVVYRDGRWTSPPGGIQRIYFRFPRPLGRQQMQRYGSGEVITVPRHTTTARVTTLITASTWSPHPSLTPLMPWIRPLAAAVRQTPLAGALGLAARAGGPSEGREEDRRSARFVIAAVAHGENGSGRNALVEGGDFYGLTGATLARGALELARTPTRVGVLPPAGAVDPWELLDSLSDHGLRWRLG